MKLNSDFKAYLSAYHNEVTGSRLLLVVHFPDGRVSKIMIDCGYFQEISHRHLNYECDCDPTNIDAILVTHNHIDHTGLLPRMVKDGYSGKIYMTETTKFLLPKFLVDCCEQQEENAKYLRDKYPNDAWKFDTLYIKEDVDKTLRLCEGVKFRKTIEVVPGIKVTYFVNGHLMGAGMILVQCNYYRRKPLNFFFTGDFKSTNPFFRVGALPKWLLNMELNMICESTYGTTTSAEVKKCFCENISEAIKMRLNVLIGAFAQGRFQGDLLYIKQLQDEGVIPDDYVICVDGPLAIDTTIRYQMILEKLNPDMVDFLPKNIKVVDPKEREDILNQGHKVILITTSGMLSNGPAKVYVPMFLQRKDCMIHLTGYAAEETIARALLETEEFGIVKVGQEEIEKRAIVRTTGEFSSHATMDELVEFINGFKHIKFLAINHGEASVKESFKETVEDYCPNVEMVDILDRNHMFCIYQFGMSGEKFSNVLIKPQPAKLDVLEPRFNKKNWAARKDKKKTAARKRQAKANKSRGKYDGRQHRNRRG